MIMKLLLVPSVKEYQERLEILLDKWNIKQ